MNTYKALKDSQVKRLNALTEGSTFAASNYDQFAMNCERMGIDPVKPDEVFVLSETTYLGGSTKVYCLKSMESRVVDLVLAFADEFEKLYDGDETGDGFITDMLTYYKETNSEDLPPESVIELCGLTNALLESDPRLVKAYKNVFPEQEEPVVETDEQVEEETKTEEPEPVEEQPETVETETVEEEPEESEENGDEPVSEA